MIEDTFWLPRKMVGAGRLFMLKVTGDSMTGASILWSNGLRLFGLESAA